MERKVSTLNLKIGMYVANLDRPWLDTPFLLQGFEIKDNDDIEALRTHCEYVFIDIEQGDGADTYLDEKTDDTKQSYVDDFIEGGKQKIVYEEGKNEFQEMPTAEVAMENAEVKIANIMDNLKAGDNLDIGTIRGAVEPVMDSMIRNSDATLWLAEMREKDAYTYSHSLDNCALGIAFGRHLGLYREDLRSLALGLLLMDVGKVKVPEAIITKETTLTKEEFAEMKNHVKYSVEILRNTHSISDSIVTIVQTHHERFDGSGYPNGLKAKQIPVFGRIASIIDCYTAMTRDSLYREAIAPHIALQSMYNWRNKYFQEELIEQFMQCIGVYPTGSLVEMTSGEVGMVLAQNKIERLKPKIMMLLNEHKEPFDGPKIVDLQITKTDSSGQDYSILTGLHPGSYGINPRDYKF